ncbi:glycosyltransferase [Desulfobacterota bacterium M19]
MTSKNPLVDMLRNIKKKFREDKFLKNITKTKHEKNVLLSYTVTPFLSNKNRHTNSQESKIIAQIFDELGFNVDVIHYTNQKKINYKRYSLLFGFGEPFENSFGKTSLKRIYYATGAHICHQNNAETRRIEDVNTKYGTNILPKRLVPWNWSMSTSLSDAIIVIGNNWTRSTYTKYTNTPVYSLNATALTNKSTTCLKRDIGRTKTCFLWFGSSGLVHKGLDLCLEYFNANSNLTLHICGPMEDDFKAVFEKILSKDNIIYHGFVDVKSKKFIDIVSQCSFSILPSCSEGQATALLTTMGAGIIPIATKFCGIDIDTMGYSLSELSVSAIDRSVAKILSLDNDTILKLSQKNQNHIRSLHTIMSFKKTLKNRISRLLNDKN